MKSLNRFLAIAAVLAVCAGAAMVGSAAVVNAATAGGKCSKVGQTQKTKGVTFVCKKTGSKLVWAKSTTSTGSSAGTVATVPATGGTTTTPALSNTPTAECKLPAADGRGDVSIGGWPRITERSKTTGTVNATVIMVDFSDAPATMTPQAAFAKISGATATFSEVSYGQLNYAFNPQYKWYRMSKSASEYDPLGPTFEKHRAYLSEALQLADPDVDFSKSESFIVLTDPNNVPFVAGPAFAAISDPITLDNTDFYNGTGSAADLATWGFMWANHELSHTLGLVDLYAYESEDPKNNFDSIRFSGQFSYMGDLSPESFSPGLFAFERCNL
ncbi:MAG: hypothetical protein ACO3CN_07230, partial [Candidatus Nanopelagicales bacterium]